MDDEETTPPSGTRGASSGDRDIANAGLCYQSIATRLSEVSRVLYALPLHHRRALLVDLGRELRRLGDITHDFARGVEALVKELDR